MEGWDENLYFVKVRNKNLFGNEKLLVHTILIIVEPQMTSHYLGPVLETRIRSLRIPYCFNIDEDVKTAMQ